MTNTVKRLCMARRDDTRKDSSQSGDPVEDAGRASVTVGPAQVQVTRTSTNPNPATPGVACFGPFRLRPTERLLEKDGGALKIGSRALDILIILAEHAPEVVSKDEIIARVWEKLVVDEVSLRVHVAALRKTLGDSDSATQYVTNVPGRGYRFVAPLTWTTGLAIPKETTAIPQPRLPRLPLRIVGRDDVVHEITSQLKARRFVSIVGPGGIGKTTVALVVAHQGFTEFRGVVHFLDLAGIEDPRLLPSALAAQLGISVCDDPEVLLAQLREQRMLLVLDSCERLVESVASLAENIFCEAPQVHILVTSREALRAEGEQVHHLSPLECPPSDVESLTATEALGFPAVQLFVKQVAASSRAFELRDAEASTVAEICRRLDGIPLALELAACRVGVYGIRGTASLLDDQFRLLWHGRRTALARHQTLSATLDWSYSLLSNNERLALRRLAVFVGTFSPEAALAIVGEDLNCASVTEILDTLVEKSLVTLESTPALRYRLLDTTRAYAWQKLTDSGERSQISRRHCEYFAYTLEQYKASAAAPLRAECVNFFATNLSNVRAALEWCFSEQGETTNLGVRLTAACAPLFYQRTLLPECIVWAERALRALDTVRSGTPCRLGLLACYGLSLLATRGNVPAAHTAVVRALELVESCKDVPTELLLLLGLFRWQVRSGDFRGLAELTARFEAVANQIDDPLADALAHAIAAITCCQLGVLREVPRHTRIAFDGPMDSPKLSAASFYYIHRVGIRTVLARSLWLLGYADQALETAREVVEETEDLGNPPTFAYIGGSTVIVYLRTGRWQAAEELIDRLSSCISKHRLSTYAPLALGWQGSLAVLRGDLSRGIDSLQTSLAALRTDGYQLHSRVLSAVLAEGLTKAGQIELAHSTICEAVAWSESHGASSDHAELLRIKGEILIARSPSDTSQGEACLQQALQLAQKQCALSLELRAAISLARLWADHGQIDRALELLAPLYGRFSEGLQTPDLAAASGLLDELRSRS